VGVGRKNGEEKMVNRGWYTVQDTAKYFGVSKQIVQRWARKGILQIHKIGDGVSLIKTEDVEKLLSATRQTVFVHDDEISKLLLNETGKIRNLSDIYLTVAQTDVFKFLDEMGYFLQRVMDYGNRKNIDDDPVTASIMRITGCALYIGVSACIQLEFALHWSEIYNTEYEYAINVRSYMECVARVHKGLRLARTFVQNRDKDALEKSSKRLVTKHTPDPLAQNLLKLFQGYMKNRNKEQLIEQYDHLIESQQQTEATVRAYGITTLIDSLRDVIPNVVEEYDGLSEYLHGDFSTHYLNRRITHFQGMKVQQSSVILKYKPLVEKLRSTLQEDLEFLRQLTMPLKKRLDAEDNKDES
jgi:excisionase family DNA binding protein